MTYRFHLENNHGKDKTICPKCGRKSLTLYVDDDSGKAIGKAIGRCDHESSCGYHYTPSDYFHDEGIIFEKRIRYNTNKKEVTKKTIHYIPDGESMMRESEMTVTTFHQFLRGLVTMEDYERVCRMYHLGGWSASSFKNTRGNNPTVYWQIDKEGKVRTGKVMVYGQDGHRIKSIFPTWMHNIKSLPKGWEVSQCLFGEHLLTEYPEKTVILVEAEKTSIIGSAIYPDYIWLATGGKSSMVVSKCQALSGRKVIIYPDIDGHEDWIRYAKDIKSSVKDCKVIVSDILKVHATPDEVSKKIDIADWMIMDLMEKKDG